MRLPSPSTVVLVGLLALPQSIAHSWIEQINVIAPNGTMVGPPGFPRGNSPRGAGFSEAQMVYLVNNGPDVAPTDSMCSQTQKQYEPNPRSPRLQASPGQAIALRYQENGHVSLPETQLGKPQNRGTVFIYGTTDPRPDDTVMGIHRQWTADGNGGDRRGRLIATANYDDGQCYQINGGPISQQRQQQFKHSSVDPQGQNLWCQTDILIPQDLPAGRALTLYWLWDWPTMPGVDPGLPQGKQEIYTTCMDIDLVPRANNFQGVQNAQAYNWVPQDIGNAAVPAQMQKFGTANAVPNPAMLPFKGQPINGGSNTGSSKAPSSPSSPPTPSGKPSASAPSAAAVPSPPSTNKPLPVSSPAGQAPAPPPAVPNPPQSAPNNAPPQAVPNPPQGASNNAPPSNGGNNGIPNQNGPGNNGPSGHDNGSRRPGTAAPGVFAGTPEFGTGSGTAINPVGNSNANSPVQQQPSPAAVTPPPAPAQQPSQIVPGLGVIGKPGRVVTVETFVTETVVRTVTAGSAQSESPKSPTNIVLSPSASSATPSSPSTKGKAGLSTTAVLADDVIYQTASVVTLGGKDPKSAAADVVTPSSPPSATTASTSSTATSATSSASAAQSTPSTSSSSISSTSSALSSTSSNVTAGAESGIKVVPISSSPSSTSSLPQVRPIKRQANIGTSSANSHLLGIQPKPTATTAIPPSPSTFSTTTAKPSLKTLSRNPKAKTNTAPCTVPTNLAAIPIPTPRENVARSTEEEQRRPPCYRRHGMFKLRSRAPLYVLPAGVEEELGDDC